MNFPPFAEKATALNIVSPFLSMKLPRMSAVAASLLLSLAQSPAQTADDPSAPSNFVDRPAVFQVTTDILNKDVEPFTVTVGGYGNTLKRAGRGGFEPGMFRSRLTASADSTDRVIADGDGDLSFFDSYASGYLDNADVRVYRVVNGELKLVRTDKVPEGGTVIEKWRTPGETISPEAREAAFSWPDWARPTAERWFTVFAINADGTLSPAGNVTKLPFAKVAKGGKAQNQTIQFQAPKKAAGLPAPAAPGNVQARLDDNGLIRLTWEPSASEGVVGYKIGYSDTDPSNLRGMYLQLSRQPANPDEAVKTGDMIIVSKLMAPFKPEYLSNRIGALGSALSKWLPYGVPNPIAAQEGQWRMVSHPANTPVENPGKTYLEVTVKQGDTQKIGLSGIPDISTTQQTFYQVPEETEYTMEVWMKADRADAPPVIFQFDGDPNVGGFLDPYSMQVTTEWKKYTHTFMGRPSDKGFHAYFVLACSGPATYSFDNFRIYRTDTGYLDYGKTDYDRLKDSGVMSIRTHFPIKTFTNTYSMDQYTDPNGTVEDIPNGLSLGGGLAMMQKAGVRPWLQIEYHMTPEEWLGFVEFMAAPYDPAKDTPQSKPWAYKRFQQGRAEPWTDAFDRIYFELSNEIWNSLFAPWTFSDMADSATGQAVGRSKVHALYNDYVMGILRSSPYWTKELDAKFVNVLGGWAIGNYNEGLATSKTGNFLTIAAYNGGWDAGEGPARPNPPSYFNVLNFANQSAIPGAEQLVENAIKWEKQNGHRFELGTYEAGPGYALNGLNNANVTKQQDDEQEQVMKSKLAGVATLDTFLAQAAYDFDLQNFFTFAEGSHWTSHVRSFAGGYPHPSFLYLSLFNREGTGDMLKINTESVPTVDIPSFKRRKGVDSAPEAAVYATRKGDRVNVFVISRRYPNYPAESGEGLTPVSLKLPFTKASKVTLHRATGVPEDTNLDGERVKLETVDIKPGALKPDGTFAVSADTGGDARGLPPAEAYLYVFEGTDIGQAGKELTREELTQLPTTFKGQ